MSVRWCLIPSSPSPKRNSREVNIASLSVRRNVGFPYFSMASSRWRRRVMLALSHKPCKQRLAREPCSTRPRMWWTLPPVSDVPVRSIAQIRLRGTGIETYFRDTKDQRFGMGMDVIHLKSPARCACLVLISAWELKRPSRKRPVQLSFSFALRAISSFRQRMNQLWCDPASGVVLKRSRSLCSSGQGPRPRSNL